MVRYARHEEQDSTLRVAQWWNALCLWARVLWFEWLVFLQIILRPQFFPEWQFRAGGDDLAPSAAPFVRMEVVAGDPVAGLGGDRVVDREPVGCSARNFSGKEYARPSSGPAAGFYLRAPGADIPRTVRFLREWMGWTTNWGFKILTHLGIRRSLIDDFYLRLKLFRLFENHGAPPTLKDLTFPVLIVASPLQILDTAPSQLWPGVRVTSRSSTRCARASPCRDYFRRPSSPARISTIRWRAHKSPSGWTWWMHPWCAIIRCPR